MIEARGYTGEAVVMSTKRETTGSSAKLVVTADRQTLKADGEDVGMFAVEVQDAQGRLVPITENEVTFTVSGAGRLVGTGNGDPTNQEPDKGSSRKAFGGYCMGLVQAGKKERKHHGGGRFAGPFFSKGDSGGDCGRAASASAAWERAVPEVRALLVCGGRHQDRRCPA